MKQGPKNHLSQTAKTAEKRQQLPLRQRQSGNTLKKDVLEKYKIFPMNVPYHDNQVKTLGTIFLNIIMCNLTKYILRF